MKPRRTARALHPTIVATVVAVGVGLLVSGASPVAAQTGDRLDLDAALATVDRMTADELAQDGVGSVTVGVVFRDALVWTGRAPRSVAPPAASTSSTCATRSSHRWE